MFEHWTSAAQAAKSWPFTEAREIIKRLDRAPKSGPVIFETGYGPSGLPHIGTFGEVARTTMVRNAFRALTGDAVPTQLICFSDDMDGLRKVPDNVPNAEMLSEDLGKPLTVVRDPFGTHASFGAHNNARLMAFLDQYGFDYTFASSTDYYTSGRFDATLLIALERFEKILEVMLPTLGPDRRATYSPFMPISPTTGRVLQTQTLERNIAKGTIVFADEDGSKAEVPVTGGHVKMQWKPDWAMRWAAIGVDYEMSGKDLIDSVKASSQICRALGGTPPAGFNYELFLDENAQKISKSRGNGLTMEQWLTYGTPESLSLYMFQSPKSAKRLHFDVIPKAIDEYSSFIEAYAREADDAKRIDNPAWHIHGGQPPAKGSPLTFNLLLNLVSAANADTTDILWGFIGRYAPGATADSDPMLAQLAERAVRYFHDFVKPTKHRRTPDAREHAALSDLAARLETLGDSADAEALQTLVFEVGKAHGFEPLRDWFTALYEVLLGSSQGPRFGSFIALYGVTETRALIASAL
jgi:lysyl-tRNA synthetase class 1